MQMEQTQSEPDVEEVVQVFERALTACRHGSITVRTPRPPALSHLDVLSLSTLTSHLSTGSDV